MTPAPAGLSRRVLLTGLGAAAAMPATAQDLAIRVVVRERLLRENAAAARLARAETDLTARLQALIDQTKQDLADEEAELTRLRGELAPAEFDARVTDFDRRVRLARQVAQERAARLQRIFQEARAKIVSALPQVMEQLRAESGATLLLNGDQILAAAPGVDLTERAITLFDATVVLGEVPDLDVTEPLIPPAATLPVPDTSDGQ